MPGAAANQAWTLSSLPRRIGKALIIEGNTRKNKGFQSQAPGDLDHPRVPTSLGGKFALSFSISLVPHQLQPS